MARRRVLTIVTERKLSELTELPTDSPALEATGVVAKDSCFYVVFGNVRRIARINSDLTRRSNTPAWFGRARAGEGYQDIAFSPHTRRFYLLIKAEKHPDGTLKALIDECDEKGRYKLRRWVDFPFDQQNHGFEGLCAVRWKDCDYLLALGHRRPRPGRKPDGGQIYVLKRAGTVWKPIAQIALPPGVKFKNHSTVSLRGSQIAVISQQTSRLWIGTLKFGNWTISDPGAVYDFPRTKKGNPKYGALEGLCWRSPGSFVLVSGLCGRDDAKRCRKREQSIHVFRIPTRGSGLLSRRG